MFGLRLGLIVVGLAGTGLVVLGACASRELAVSEPPAAATPAQAFEPAPERGVYGEVPGVEVLDRGGIHAFVLHGAKEKVELTKVAVEGQAFSEAVQARVKEASTNNWDVQLQTPIKKPVEQGDVLLAKFHFRTDWVPDESGEGVTEFVFELARDPWTKSVTYPIRASRDWKEVYVPFVAQDSFGAGEAQVIFRLGYSPETIQIGGVTVENFGKKLAVSDLPTTKLTYAGMAPDAAWRAAAAERIEKQRKGDVKVVVTNAAGKPMGSADVLLELKDHAFGFGTCVVANKLTQPGSDRYKKVLDDYFNIATVENSFKWVALEGDWGPGFTLQSAEGAVKWLSDQGIQTRGHVLIWPGWRNLPKSLAAFEKQPEELRKRVRSHIKELASRTKGSLVHWDVMNEPFDNHDLIDILGKDEMVEWFKIARAADPRAQLFINDYGILSGGGGESPHRAHYEETIKYLIDKGAPLDGIGLQGHFGTSLTSPEDLLKLLDRYAKFGKPLWVTEYDLVLDDEELAARYTEDFYTVLFSHPAVQGVIMWGFWDGAHWKKNAPMFRDDWSMKPSGQVFSDLVKKRWHTEVTGKTDAKGSVAFRGFLGDYDVTVSHGEHTKTVDGAIVAEGSTIVVKLE